MIWLILLAVAVGYLTGLFIQLLAIGAGAHLPGMAKWLVFVSATTVALYVLGVLPV